MTRYCALGLLMTMLLLAHATMVWAEQPDEELGAVARDIADAIALDQALFLDLRCGEFSPALSKNLSQLLLEQGADIRQSSAHSFYTEFDPESESISLDEYGLQQALLVQVQLNIKWVTKEHKSFLSYRTERKAVHSFEVKQVQLPGRQLIDIDSFEYMQPDSAENTVSAPHLRWFEPLIATTAIASIIFLLWTME
ncbi:MAG: hypothetical protein PHT37_06645 [Candidatus Cloacimonetes bacterium]|nr:hypothetical protein [Candidatus Cloacimonadota bacterium]MDD3563181.1 hypothetical protein [Candidatus Cloacimonadota bacterium]MDD4277544.1 hypothetical protein [Candidatus Cloacimonadota bacterium]MDY0326408.1 hypothetical protein [Candidatus Cloacimonadaceae bacterium]